MLSQEDKKFYEDLNEVFNLPGWKKLVADGAAQIDHHLRECATLKDYGDIREAQGKIAVLERLVHLQEITESSYQHAMAESDTADEVE